MLEKLVGILEHPPVKVAFTIAYGFFLAMGIWANYNEAQFFKASLADLNNKSNNQIEE